MLRLLTQNKWRGTVCAVLTAFVQLSCFAQSAPENAAQTTPQINERPAKAQGGAADQQVPQAILNELEAMRKRIDELEAQLKAQKTQEQPATVSAAFPVKAAMMADASAPTASANAEVPAGQPGMQEAAKATAPANPETTKAEPFAFADFTWLNGNVGPKELPFDTKFFTPEIRADVDYIYDFNHPADDTIGGSSEVFRAQEFQVTQLGVEATSTGTMFRHA